MQDPVSHQHRAREPVAVSPSLLRLSVPERLVIVAVLVVCLWGAVLWALTGTAS